MVDNVIGADMNNTVTENCEPVPPAEPTPGPVPPAEPTPEL